MGFANRFDLSGRVAVITGGAGDIGKVYARALCEAGASVVIADLAVTAAHAVADELRDSGFRAHACTVDVTSTESVDAMAQNAIAPGFVESESGYAALPKDSDFRTTIMAPIPGKKSAPPTDLVGALLLLCSPAGDWINGQTLIIDGRWITRL